MSTLYRFNSRVLTSEQRALESPVRSKINVGVDPKRLEIDTLDILSLQLEENLKMAS